MSRDLILLAISMMTWGVGEGMFLIFQPLYLQQFGASPVIIGTLLGGAGIAMTVAHIPAGYLADRIGRRPLLWTAWIMATMATWLMALAHSLPVFVIGMMVYGLTAFVSSPMNSYITAARGKLRVGRAITMITAFYNMGAVLGPWLGGQVGKRFGLQTIYLLAGCLFILSTIILLFIKSQPVEKHEAEEKRNRLQIDQQFVIYLVVIFIAGFSMYIAQPLSSNFLQNQHHLTFDIIGSLGSVSSFGVVVLSLSLGSLNARAGYLLAQVAMSIFTLVLWRGNGIAWFCLGYFLIGGYRVARSLAAAQTRYLVHQARMGFAYGITETVGASAIILASPIAGYLYDVNPILMYIVGFGMILFSILISLRFIPKPRVTM